MKDIFCSQHCTKKIFIKDFFSKCEQIRWKLRIWSHLLRKSLMENFIFCAVNVKLLQPFHVSVLFLYTLKTLENVWFRNGTLT